MLEGMKPPSKVGPCIVARNSEQLSKEDKKVLEESLNSPLWSHSALADELTKRGFVVGKDSISKHRKGICSCAR